MNETAFLNIGRHGKYMRLELDSGEPQYSGDYAYIQIPLKELYNPSDEKVVTKALRNQHLLVIPACRINLQGNYRVLVKTNPKLQEVANCPALFLLDPKEGESPSFYATFRKDVEVSDIDWAVRLYMLA